jgi:hypothetical protein
MLSNVQEELIKNYDLKPMVIIHETKQLEALTKLCKEQKFVFRVGPTSDNLFEIKDWTYGLLLLNKAECRGVDARFA